MDLWNDLETEAGLEGELLKTGSLDIGHRNSSIFRGSLNSCVQDGLEYEILDAKQLHERFPAFTGMPAFENPDEGYVACYQPDGGFLSSEDCISAYVDCARKRGAIVKENQKVSGYTILDDGTIQVKSGDGVYRAKKIIITAGTWTKDLVPDVAETAKLEPERQALAWFEPPAPHNDTVSDFAPSKLPVFIMQYDGREYYGFPEYKDRGVKVGLFNHQFEVVDPDTYSRVVTDEDVDIIRPFMKYFFPRIGTK